MSEFTQIKLGTLIGVWRYGLGGNTKYYIVIPTGKNFVIRWGKTLDEANARKEHIVVEDSKEVYSRILSKARGGFQLVSTVSEAMWTPQCHDEFNSVEEILEMEKTKARKRKPRKRKLSLLDWVGGLEEYRENDSL
jgi:hypothetical protein